MGLAMKNQELTLLFVFDAIMTEASMSRAAERLGMTQPAVSNMVARMRNQWNDPLFIKKGRTIEPTAFAQSLWEQVKSPIFELANAVNTTEFDPATSKRKFRIALGDFAVDMFWLPLTHLLAEKAPYIDMYAVPFNLMQSTNQLREAHVDFAIGPAQTADKSVRSVELFKTHFVVAMRQDHPLAGQTLTLESYLAARHLLVSTSGDASGFVDQELERQGLKRRVAVTVNHFSAVSKLLLNSDLIAVVPQMVAGATQYRDQLWLTESPLALEASEVHLMWHTRHDRDQGLLWMRNILQSIAKNQWSKCTECPQKRLPVHQLETLT